MAEYRNNTVYFVHGDHLGSTRLVTGLNQAVVQNLDYLPFGENNSTDSHISTHEFTGDERDSETGLDHTQFRQYTSQLARWITPDLLGGEIGDPQSLNRYAYVLNNPLNLIDPLGLDCVDVVNPDGSISTTCTVSANGPDGGGLLPGQCFDIFLDGFFFGISCDGSSGGRETTRRSGGGPGSRGGGAGGRGGGKPTMGPAKLPSPPPPTRPSCFAVFLDSANAALDAMNLPVLPPGSDLGDAAKAAAGAAALNHIVNQGLVVPLRSTIVRNILATGEVAAYAFAAVPAIFAEVAGLRQQWKGMRAGTCHNIWSN